MARLKRVMPAQDVAFMFVRRTQSNARTPTKNFWFDHRLAFEADEITPIPVKDPVAETLMSYSTAIASRFMFPDKQPIIFVTEDKYSVTTSRQVNDLIYVLTNYSVEWMSIPDEVPTSVFAIERTWVSLIRRAEWHWDKSKRARTRYDEHLQKGNRYIESANRIIEIFDGFELPIANFDDVRETWRFYKTQQKLRGVS